MSQTGPWSVKGIDQRARNAARQAARERGITLGEYLNTLLMVDDAPAPPPFTAAPEPFAAAPEPYAAPPESHAPPQYPPQPYQRDAFSGRTATQSLDQLTRRIEAAEARSTLAITGIDQSVLGLLARLERSEESNAALAAHVDTVLDDISTTHDTLQDKVRTLESDDTQNRNLETLQTLEQALGELASHVNDENALVQDETSAIKARVEAGLGDVTERLEGMEVKVDTTLTGAAQRVEDAVEQAEKQTRDLKQNFADRFSALEGDVTGRLARVDSVNEKLDDVTGDVAGALESMEHTLARVQERLNRAETTTDSALKSLDDTFDNLDKRIETVAKHASPEAAEELRRQFEERFEGLAADVHASVASARAELAEEIERTASTAAPEAIQEIEAKVANVEERLATTEAKQADAILSGGGASAEAVRHEFSRLSETVENRLAEMETREADAINRVSEQIGGVVDGLNERVEVSEQRSADAIEQVGEQVAIVANRLQARQEEISKTLAETMDASSKRQEARLSDALANVSERLETMQDQAAANMSPVQRAISALANRLESLENFDGAATPAAPADFSTAYETPDLPPQVEEIFAEAPKQTFVEDTPPPAAAATPTPPPMDHEFEDEIDLSHPDGKPAEPAAPEAKQDTGFEAGFDSWDEAPAAGTPSPSGDPFDDLGGLIDPLFEDAAEPGGESSAEFVTDQPEPGPAADPFAEFEAASGDDPLSALEEWDDGAGEARESDIFDDQDAEPDPAASFEEAFEEDFFSQTPDSGFETDRPAAPPMADAADDVPEDYLLRARRAAQAAAGEVPQPPAKRRKAKAKAPSAKHANAMASTGSSRAPLYAAASAVVVAAAGASGYLYLRGKQTTTPAVQTSAPDPASSLAGLAEATPSTAPDETLASGDTAEVAEASTSDPSDPEAIAPLPMPETSVNVAVADVQSALEPIPDLPTLEEAADAGNAVAQFTLGTERLDASDYAMAASLIRRAADQGQPAAQYRLAKLHERGLGVPRDLVAAREWTQRSARNGNIKAMHDLAVFFAEGEGGAQSYAGAVEWFRKASEYGVVDSQYNLGVLYEQGLGISPDLGEALTWFEIAAREGDTGAPAKVQALRERVSPDVAAEATRKAGTWSAALGSNEANGVFADNAWKTPLLSHVRAAQVALDRFGYSPGVADGSIGPATDEAIRSFQRDAQVNISGRIDEPTIRALNARISTTTTSGAL